MSEIVRPLIPGFELVAGAQRVEQDKIIEPPGIFRAESFEPAQVPRLDPDFKKGSGRFKQERNFLREDAFVFDRPEAVGDAVDLCRVDLGAVDPAVIGQALEADQQRISGKSGSDGVGRIPVAERAQRQDLPNALPGRRKKIYEAVGGGTEIADTAA